MCDENTSSKKFVIVNCDASRCGWNDKNGHCTQTNVFISEEGMKPVCQDINVSSVQE